MVVKGKKLTLKEHWEKLKSELKDMTPKQKLEHLWEYYKWVLGVLLAVVVIVGTVIGSIITLNTEVILAGAIINVPVNMEGYSKLQNGYYDHAKTGGRQAVEMTSFTFVDPLSTVEKTYTWDVVDSITAMLGSDNLDYVLYDSFAATYFMSPDYFADLRELFSEEELASMGNAVIMLQIEKTGEKMPIAIDIRDTAFYNTYVAGEEPIYLSFSVRLPRKDACKDFWHYIKGGETAFLQTVIAGVAVDAPLGEGKTESLVDDFFRDQNCVAGDHRVELTQQSFLPAVDEEGQDMAPMIREYVLSALSDGSLDYVLCGADALAQLNKADLMDLMQILPKEDMKALENALIMEDGTAVAVDVSALPAFSDGAEGPVYLAFSAKTERLQACKDLWNMIYAK